MPRLLNDASDPLTHGQEVGYERQRAPDQCTQRGYEWRGSQELQLPTREFHLREKCQRGYRALPG